MKLHTICFLVHAELSSPKKIADAILSGQTFFADPFEPCKLQRLRYLMAIIANRNLALCKTSIFRHFNLNVSIVFLSASIALRALHVLVQGRRRIRRRRR